MHKTQMFPLCVHFCVDKAMFTCIIVYIESWRHSLERRKSYVRNFFKDKSAGAEIL